MFRKVEPTSLISNGVVLRQEAIVVCGLKIFGTNFFWPCPTGNPYYDQIPDDCDVLMAHGPPKGIVDGDAGCPSLTEHIEKRNVKLGVFGHIHSAHGVTTSGESTFVNAAMCKDGYSIGWDPVVVELQLPRVVNDDNDNNNDDNNNDNDDEKIDEPQNND